MGSGGEVSQGHPSVDEYLGRSLDRHNAVDEPLSDVDTDRKHGILPCNRGIRRQNIAPVPVRLGDRAAARFRKALRSHKSESNSKKSGQLQSSTIGLFGKGASLWLA
mmetsp:Transcript_32804/g.79791  ORF Transcript_32804/g.79791 Transcript_32804/m.79791 type:complete len:107 (-) Transcript_32804:1014-1334(-)